MDMSVQMMDPHERKAPAPGYPFRRGESDEKGGNETWPAGHRQGADLTQRDRGVFQGGAKNRLNHLHMAARGKLRDHTSEPFMNVLLMGNNIR
jgi:hypothetical protein